MSAVYCSLPVSIRNREIILDTVRENLRTFANTSSAVKNLSFDSWSQGKTYDPWCVKKCDVFFFMHPENRFEFHVQSLPIGVKKEYEQAKNLKKEIFLLYKTKDGNICPFRIRDYSGIIKGIPGSTGELYGWLNRNCGLLVGSVADSGKHVAQIGKQKEDVVEDYDEGYPFRVPQLTEKVISVIDLSYDRRLLIE